MRKVDTSVVNITRALPGLANINGQNITTGDINKLVGLDFLQQAIRDVSTGLALALTQNANNPTVLAGCQRTGASFTAGWVFYSGEIYYVPAQTISGSGSFIAANITPNPIDNGSIAPLTTMSDGSTVSIHNLNTITLSFSLIANSGNFPDFGDWYPTAVVLTNWVSIAVNPGYAASWSDKGAPFNIGRYRRVGPNVQLSGVLLGTANTTSVAFTLPSSYTPAATSNFFVWSNGSTPALVSISSVGICTITLPLGQTECSLEGIIFPVY